MPRLMGACLQKVKALAPGAELYSAGGGQILTLPKDNRQLVNWYNQLYPYWQMGKANNFTTVNILRRHNLTVAVAESCSGGRIASLLTDVPGASEVFVAGVTAYTPQAKTDFLQIPLNLIPSGAVSAELTAHMASQIRQLSGADIGLATTGVLGPSTPAPDLPVGLVWIALSWGDIIDCRDFYFYGVRETIKKMASSAALNFLMAFTVRCLKCKNTLS